MAFMHQDLEMFALQQCPHWEVDGVHQLQQENRTTIESYMSTYKNMLAFF